MKQSQRGGSGSTQGGLCRRIIPIKSRQVLAYRGQVAGMYQILRLQAGNQSVAHRGKKCAVHTISQFQGMGIADIQSPVTSGEYQYQAPSTQLLSPGVLTADVRM